MVLKNSLIVLSLCISFVLGAQHTISGNLSPADDYKWLIAYRLNPDSQNYVADTAVKNGFFSLEIPNNATPGIYRLVYAVPQEEFYFDVIYNGKEDIVLSFNAQDGSTFESSPENILFNNYFRDINGSEQEIVQFYSQQNKDRGVFQEIAKKMAEVQKSYETKSEGMISGHFITANKPYIPLGYESMETYIENKKRHYFDELDFNDPILQGSDFLNNKATNYVFTALTLSEVLDKEVEMRTNVDQLASVLKQLGTAYKVQLFHSIWTEALHNHYTATADYVYDNYLKSWAVETKNSELIHKIETHNRLRLGAPAPEITWDQGDTRKRLSDLPAAKNYVIVFWSSGCSHCLQELPELHNGLKDISGVNVLAIGLEDDEVTWKKESAKLTAFIHGIALGKWESPYTTLYDIHQTPTYYILDKTKHIVAKPDNYKEVLAFLKGSK